MPCRLLFEEQDAAYKQAVWARRTPAWRSRRRWRWAGSATSGSQGRFVGMHGFGESGKIADVYKKFDITTEAVVRAAREVVREVAA